MKVDGWIFLSGDGRMAFRRKVVGQMVFLLEIMEWKSSSFSEDGGKTPIFKFFCAKITGLPDFSS